MKPKAARKILRKYNNKMLNHRVGNATAPAWLLRLWKKATKAALTE